MNIKTAWTLVQRTVKKWREDEASRFAAALAFYTMFSIAPLLIIVIGVTGIILGEAAAEGEVAEQLEDLVGASSAELVQSAIQRMNRTGASVWATAIGFVTLFIGATTLFSELQNDLNKLWKVKVKPGMGIWGLLRTRLLAFVMILVVGFLLLLSVVLSTVLTSLGAYFADFIPELPTILRIANFLISFLIVVLLFAAIYKYLPDVQLRWRDVWVGAVVTGLLFVIGKYFIGLYLGRSTLASIFGAAGALVIILLWVYYSAQILFFGAEFTQAQINIRGEIIQPAKYAEKIQKK